MRRWCSNEMRRWRRTFVRPCTVSIDAPAWGPVALSLQKERYRFY
jgi:hypothetical protein